MDAWAGADGVGGSETVPPRPTFDVLISDTGAGLLVHLQGELDVETASGFLEKLTASLPGREVELDLSGLTFLDVAGVRALVTVHDQMSSDGGCVRVRGLDETRLPAARILGLGRHLGARASGQDESR
jgi:anti-anti-sigma factor